MFVPNVCMVGIHIDKIMSAKSLKTGRDVDDEEAIYVHYNHVAFYK